MSQFVTDTHPLIWYLTGNPRLSAGAKDAFLETDQGLHQILIPGIVLVEMVYLKEKGVISGPYCGIDVSDYSSDGV